MFLFLFGAPYRANDDYRYSESLRNITGDNRSARPILCSYFQVLENVHTHIHTHITVCDSVWYLIVIKYRRISLSQYGAPISADSS